MTTHTDDIREALEAIRKSGGLTPSRVLRVAKNPDSVLHPRFEWDDAKAGHQYRLWQARQLISAKVFKPEGADRFLRSYVHVPSPAGEGEYILSSSIVHHPDKLAIARDVAVRALTAAEDNVAELDEIVSLFSPKERTEDRRARTGRARAHIADARAELVGV